MEIKRITANVDEDTYERVKYWSDRREISINDYIRLAVDNQIKYENRDFDIPDILVTRLNQIQGLLRDLESSNDNLNKTVVKGFDSLIGLTRGENYLLEED